MKDTKLAHNTKRKKFKKRLVLLVLVTIIPIFLISFFVGNSSAADEQTMKQEKPKKIDPSTEKNQEIKVEGNTTDHSNLDSTKEAEKVEKPTNPEQQKTEENDKPKEEPLGKVVYLTFDDGPSRLTAQFLDVLQAHDVKATFFMQGTNLNKEHLQVHVKRAVTEGHYIGAHSMTHDYKKLYNDNQFVPEMKETLSLISEITGTTPNLVRPPYGSAPGLNGEQIRNQIVENDIKVWDWTIDSYDWALKGNPNKILENIKNGTITDREVVLMHEHPQTLDALPKIIEFYKEQGYKFVVYDEEHHFDLNFQKDKRL